MATSTTIQSLAKPATVGNTVTPQNKTRLLVRNPFLMLLCFARPKKRKKKVLNMKNHHVQEG
jgi:hypothetical protein